MNIEHRVLICFVFVCKQVFYLDYGNTEYVEFDVLYEWDIMCNVLPFQAVLCQLGDLHDLATGSVRQEVLNYMSNNYLNQPCQILVLCVKFNSLQKSCRIDCKSENKSKILCILWSISYRDQMDQGLLVKMKNAQGREIVSEINEKLFPRIVQMRKQQQQQQSTAMKKNQTIRIMSKQFQT